MKTIRWSVLAVIALGAAGLLLARGDTVRTTDADSEVRALRRQAEELQSRLKTLEQRLTKVESAKPSVPPRIEILPRSSNAPPMILVPPHRDALKRSGQSPKIWGGGDINGWPYCYIPCEGR
jgi:hypothetical protein